MRVEDRAREFRLKMVTAANTGDAGDLSDLIFKTFQQVRDDALDDAAAAAEIALAKTAAGDIRRMKIG